MRHSESIVPGILLAALTILSGCASERVRNAPASIGTNSGSPPVTSVGADVPVVLAVIISSNDAGFLRRRPVSRPATKADRDIGRE